MGGLAGKPDGATWLQILGVALLGGIGFTMSLFIGMLAFPDPAEAASLRLGVLTGSLLSAVAGLLDTGGVGARAGANFVAQRVAAARTMGMILDSSVSAEIGPMCL